ncbi:MAG: hypothetical protein ACLQAT_11010 [Candidatus Binataceae bacterium]
MSKPAFRAMRPVFFLAAICAALVAGCSGKSPQHAAQSYVDDLKLFNYPAAYQLLTHQDQVDRTIDQFLTEIPLAPDVNRDWFKTILHAVDFEVGDAAMEGDSKANVTVKVTRPDLTLWERTIDATLSGDQTADSVAQKQINDGSYPKLSYDDNIVAMKVGDDWRVFVDFPAKEDVAKMRKDAIDAYHKYDYDKAISTYQSAIAELDKEEATGNAGLKFLYNRELQTIQNVKNQIPDGQAYISKIGLTDVDMKMSASRVPGIFGKITNNGDKSIDEIQFTVTYSEGKGAKKKQVYSETHTPIATPIDFTNFTRPVLPFVPGETRSFGFRLTAPADIQQKATPDLNVTTIVFTQSTAPLPKPVVATPTPSPEASAAPSPGAAAASPAMAPLPSPPKQ